jgi:cell division protein FtsW (lipid II flippase)
MLSFYPASIVFFGLKLTTSASMAGRDHAFYFVWRQVFTAAAGVAWLTDRRLPLALCRKW